MTTAPPAARHVWPLRRSDDDPLIFLGELAATGIDVVPFRLGRRPAFLLNHPEVLDEVLVRQAALFERPRSCSPRWHNAGVSPDRRAHPSCRTRG